MATLYIRTRDTGDGRRFDVRYRRGGRYSKVEHGGSFRTRNEALIRKKVIGEWLAGGLNPKVEMERAQVGGSLFRDTYTEWLASRRSVSQGTLDGYTYRARVLLDAFGDRPVDQISVRDVSEWVGSLDGYKPGTVRLFVAQLRMVLDFADVPVNVARDRRVELPRNVATEPVPPDRYDVLRILEHVPRSHRLPVVVMEQLGCRVTETLTLQPGDVDAKTGSVRVARERSKGQRVGRTIDAPEFLLEALEDSLPFRVGDRNRVGDKMRGTGFSPHSLRHRRATLWHQSGVEAVELARRLGHSRPSMSLDVYANVTRLSEVPAHALAAFLR